MSKISPIFSRVQIKVRSIHKSENFIHTCQSCWQEEIFLRPLLEEDLEFFFQTSSQEAWGIRSFSETWKHVNPVVVHWWVPLNPNVDNLNSWFIQYSTLNSKFAWFEGFSLGICYILFESSWRHLLFRTSCMELIRFATDLSFVHWRNSCILKSFSQDSTSQEKRACNRNTCVSPCGWPVWTTKPHGTRFSSCSCNA